VHNPETGQPSDDAARFATATRDETVTRDATATREKFGAYLGELIDTARRAPDIVGLVGMGSTAERHRVDEWSDHDFALVTADGAQDRYRADLAWLPASSSIALSVVEHHGGVKVIHDDGHVLEFGIASIDQLATWYANAYDVLYDAGGVAEAMALVAARPLPTGEPDDARDIRLVMTQLLIGVGRARRGEALSASTIIRAEAVAYLLTVLGRRLPGDSSRLDALDSRRRFEFVHPALAFRISGALMLEPERAARELLEIAEEHLEPGWEDFPRRGVAALRARLGWR